MSQNLKACDQRLDLTDAIAACVSNTRQPGKVVHSFHDLVRQRVFGIACGYEECNHAGRLADDPMQKLLVERDPLVGAALASQSTLSRFDNALGPKTLMRMGNALADTVIARHRTRLKKRVKRIRVELDPTDDPTHDAQQLSFFISHYDTWCYLPGAGWRGFDSTHGEAVADTHVTVAAAAHPRDTLPVTGSFGGERVTNSLDFTVEIQCRRTKPSMLRYGIG